MCCLVPAADAMNLCLSLVTHGLADTAFLVLKSFPEAPEPLSLGNFFLRHCVAVDMVRTPQLPSI